MLKFNWINDTLSGNIRFEINNLYSKKRIFYTAMKLVIKKNLLEIFK